MKIKEVVKHIRASAGTLPPEDEAVLRMRFGVGRVAASETKIARDLGITEEAVNEIVARALAALKIDFEPEAEVVTGEEHDRVVGIARNAATEQVAQSFPVIGTILKMIGAVLGRPDLDREAVATLQNDVVRFYEMLALHLSRLDDEMKAKIDAVELAEVVSQVWVNMGRTASSEKRRLMRNVAINGIGADEAAKTIRRLFVDAATDLDLAHIELLRVSVKQTSQLVALPADDFGVALVQPLVARGFVAPLQSAAGFAYDSPDHLPISVAYQVTDLGEQFLEFTKEPEE